jgi:hypothetical protein
LGFSAALQPLVYPSNNFVKVNVFHAFEMALRTVVAANLGTGTAPKLVHLHIIGRRRVSL